jgi:transglutaminase-like putative cysteine protease
MIVHQTHSIKLKRKKVPFFDDDLDAVAVRSFNCLSSDPNPNIFYIVHETKYTYNEKVKKSKNLFRLQPLQDGSQTLLNYKLEVSVDGKVCNFTGAFGNHASFVEIKKPHKELKVVSHSIVAVSKRSFKQDLKHHPTILPMTWMPWDSMMMLAYLQPPELPESELFELAEFAMNFVKSSDGDAFDVISNISNYIYKNFEYVPGSTTLNTSAYDVFFHRKGVCQDFANLLICLARLLDLPARYRMGYIYTGQDYKNKIQSDLSHAWVEIYFPYAGWIGFDPTNGCVAGKNHVRVACGRYYNDATPTSGAVFDAAPNVESHLDASVKVYLLNTKKHN